MVLPTSHSKIAIYDESFFSLKKNSRFQRNPPLSRLSLHIPWRDEKKDKDKWRGLVKEARNVGIESGRMFCIFCGLFFSIHTRKKITREGVDDNNDNTPDPIFCVVVLNYDMIVASSSEFPETSVYSPQ